jgi:hypothetical protein
MLPNSPSESCAADRPLPSIGFIALYGYDNYSWMPPIGLVVAGPTGLGAWLGGQIIGYFFS